MCGILGSYGFEHVPIRDMLALIRHRGPDDGGVYNDGPLWLGVRRLSVIDVAGAAQPIFNEDHSLCMVFNGEIYNYQELRRDLLARGHTFSTNGDTETIVHLYEEYGRACVHLLRGMFTFAIWDTRQRALFIARDRLGIKPLYYYANGGRLAFASEIKALRLLPEIGRHIDPAAVEQLLAFQYIAGPRTIYADISCLQPGHSMWFADGNLEMTRYWAPVVESAFGELSADEVARSVRALMEDAVNLHLAADVPLGILLSGGLDSAALVALVSQSRRGIQTFTVGFNHARSAEGRPYDETTAARAVANHFATDHHDIHVDAEIVDLLPALMWHFDQPVADPAALPTYVVSRFARQSVTVALSGEGADELFGGYPRYYWASKAQRAQQHMSPGFSRTAMKLSQRAVRTPSRARKLSLLLSTMTPTERMIAWTGGATRQQRTGLLRIQRSNQQPQRALLGAGTSVHELMRADLGTWLVDDILAKGDKMSMAASLELRVPFLDHVLVDFVTSLPQSFKQPVPTTKPLLRRAVEPLLPSAVLAAPKRAFTVPIAEWLTGPLRGFATERLFGTSSADDHGMFDRSAVRRLWNEHSEGRHNHAGVLWTLICFETWYHEVFLQPERAHPLMQAAAATR